MRLMHLSDEYEPEVRSAMLNELDTDINLGQLYEGKYLSPAGKSAWPQLLRDAIESGDSDTLRAAIEPSGYWLEYYERKKPSGGTTMAKVRFDAPEMLCDDEFKRYYLRGVCIAAVANDRALEVVRVKDVARPRSGSEALIGSSVDPQQLLDDLRQNIGIDTFLGIPAGPNSGLGVEIR